MAFRRRTNLRRRRRRPTRRIRRSGKRVMRRYVPVGVTRSRYVKLQYCDGLSAQVGAGSNTTWVYQSSLFDPYYAVGGHQPLYFDQYAALYQRYLVLGISYDIAISTDQNTNGPLFVTLTPTPLAASATSLSWAREQTGTKETNVSHGYRGRLKGYISCAKVTGVSLEKFRTDDQYSALCSANPALPVYMNLQVWNSTGSMIAVYVSLRLRFYCKFFEPTEPAQS